jgi:hypothetical protein
MFMFRKFLLAAFWGLSSLKTVIVLLKLEPLIEQLKKFGLFKDFKNQIWVREVIGSAVLAKS